MSKSSCLGSAAICQVSATYMTALYLVVRAAVCSCVANGYFLQADPSITTDMLRQLHPTQPTTSRFGRESTVKVATGSESSCRFTLASGHLTHLSPDPVRGLGRIYRCLSPAPAGPGPHGSQDDLRASAASSSSVAGTPSVSMHDIPSVSTSLLWTCACQRKRSWNLAVRLHAQAVTSIMHHRICRAGQFVSILHDLIRKQPSQFNQYHKSFQEIIQMSSSCCLPSLVLLDTPLFPKLLPLLVPHRSTRHDTDAAHLHLKPFGARVRIAHLGQTIQALCCARI